MELRGESRGVVKCWCSCLRGELRGMLVLLSTGDVRAPELLSKGERS